MSAIIQARIHPAAWLLLLPLPICLFAFAHYDLVANILIDIRWLLAGVVAWDALLAALAAWAASRDSRSTLWLPCIAMLPAVTGLVVFATHRKWFAKAHCFKFAKIRN